MSEKRLSLTPETFWQIYSQEIAIALQEQNNRDAYTISSKWTPVVINIVKKILKDNYGLKAQCEFYKIDVIGYTTNTDKEQYDWELKVAYEHENDKSWNGELCKLCHIIADLRVISSYYDFTKKEKIEDVLHKYVNRIGSKRMFCVPNNSWLFVFGPCGELNRSPFRAFTVNPELEIIEIGNKKMMNFKELKT